MRKVKINDSGDTIFLQDQLVHKSDFIDENDNIYGKIISYEPTHHKTSIGRNPSKAKMNKHKRRMMGKSKNRGQGVK